VLKRACPLKDSRLKPLLHGKYQARCSLLAACNYLCSVFSSKLKTYSLKLSLLCLELAPRTFSAFSHRIPKQGKAGLSVGLVLPGLRVIEEEAGGGEVLAVTVILHQGQRIVRE